MSTASDQANENKLVSVAGNPVVPIDQNTKKLPPLAMKVPQALKEPSYAYTVFISICYALPKYLLYAYIIFCVIDSSLRLFSYAPVFVKEPVRNFLFQMLYPNGKV